MIKQFLYTILCSLVFASVANAFVPHCSGGGHPTCSEGTVKCGGSDRAVACSNGNTAYCNEYDEPSCRYTPACSDGSNLTCDRTDRVHCGGSGAHPVCQYHDQDKVNSSFRVACQSTRDGEFFTCAKRRR